MKKAGLAVVTLVAAACASSPPEATPAQSPQTAAVQAQKAAFDPVGTFEYTTVVESSQVTGTFEISRKDDGSYTGRVLSNAFPEIPISRVSVEGSKVILAASMDGQALLMEMNFTGDSFTGGWSFGDGSVGGSISGKRKAG